MHVRSLGKILFFSLSIDQNRVPFDTHSKEKTRQFRFSGLPIYNYSNYYSVAQTALHQLYLSIFSCVGLWPRNFNLSIKCQRSLINKNSNVWGYTSRGSLNFKDASRYLVQKRSTRLTQLSLPCPTVQANLYT